MNDAEILVTWALVLAGFSDSLIDLIARIC
jgi:hypothetical protein